MGYLANYGYTDGSGDWYIRIDTALCTGCGDCVAACPVERIDTYNMGLQKNKAIYLPYPMAFPLRYVVDAATCKGSSCGECAKVCPYGAVELDAKAETVTEKVSAIVVATEASGTRAKRECS